MNYKHVERQKPAKALQKPAKALQKASKSERQQPSLVRYREMFLALSNPPKPVYSRDYARRIEQLKGAIDAANGVPSRSKSEFYDKLSERQPEGEEEFSERLWVRRVIPDYVRKTLYEMIKQLNGSARSFVGKVNPKFADSFEEHDSFGEVFRRYSELCYLKGVMRYLATNKALDHTPPFPVWAIKDGVIAIDFRHELFEVLIGMEADRIRICPICDLLFWADRKDQSSCSKKCANVLRVQRWRAKSTEYELNRIHKERLLAGKKP